MKVALIIFIILSVAACIFVVAAGMLSARISRGESWEESYEQPEAKSKPAPYRSTDH